MSFAIVQFLILGALLLYSAIFAARKLAPEVTRRLLGRASAALDHASRSRLTRRVGRWLQPAEARSGGCGSGDGCGTCGGCAPAPQIESSAPMPLHIRPHRRRS
ncbi:MULTISPECIES: DUF6587 family protein [Oleiagrimonas]|jgi:hypothetical protein|uniref:Uncharacterized protein n=1 Tax=Oleiagrimonas citrea TaxID=1665687 RepID=A0A846ZJ86_9GAMM|nr:MULTISPECIES: DUF6587 family protein [Oleiagrimonas]NKZ37639.1 hypothetical protein [Oleiagrimonas citrea]RAP56426.1 hypothetical protein BTJ49_13540 [Oleiagrimonas sp. MCCC 1A03011]